MGLALLCVASGSAHADNPPARVNAHVVSVSPMLRRDRIVEVRVEGLQAWADSGAGSPWNLVPYLEQRALAGVYPVAVDTGSGTLQYLLVPGAASAGTWAHLLSPLTFERPVRFSVGLERQDAFRTAFDRADGAVRLVVLDRWSCAVAAALVLAMGACAVRLAMTTALLMESVHDGTGSTTWRYSLAKLQFALWSLVVLGAFLVIWLTTGKLDSLNASVVAVLGISAGTTVGDRLMRPAGPPVAPAAARAPPAPPSMRDFLNDLVCDASGHSIARFQMLAWTVALIGVFLLDVLDDLAMPVMGAELLYLLGLSSGTYLGHRRPDAPAPSPSPPPPPPPGH